MKNFDKILERIIMTLISPCFFPNSLSTLPVISSRKTEQHKENNITAAKQKTLEEKKIFNLRKKKQVQEFLNELNKTEIYLLVTDLKKEKNNCPILLLLHTEDRLNSEQSIINYRYSRILLNVSKTDKPKTRIRRFRINIKNIVRPEEFPLFAKTFRSGKSYYVNNLGGYKSICPVFFDKASAEDFLIQTAKKTTRLLLNSPSLKSSKEILQGLINSRICSVGLGDFLEYYSTDENKTYLEKIEFLFIPCLQNDLPAPNEKEKIIKTIVKNKTFKDYQKQYYNLIITQ
jgi:hypothetical protein